VETSVTNKPIALELRLRLQKKQQPPEQKDDAHAAAATSSSGLSSSVKALV
jgi:hypothetical protein